MASVQEAAHREACSIVKNFLSLEAEEAGESDFEEDENEIDNAQFIDDAVRDDSIRGSSSSSLSLTAKPDRTTWLDPVIQKYGGSVSEDRTSAVSETSSHVFDPHSPNLPVSPMRTSTTMDSSITSAPQTARPAPPSTSSIPSTPLPAPSMQSSITSHRLVPPASSAPTEDALRSFDVTFSALSQEDDDEDDDEAMVTSGDPVLMNLLDELVQQSEDISLFQVYSVHCRLGTENNIVGRICEDIKQGSISSNVINDAFPSKIPGRVYLVVLNVHRQNTTLAAYLSSINGFKYRNSHRLPTKEVITGTRLRTRDDGTTYMTHTSSVPPIHQSLSLDMPISTWVPYNDTYFSRLHRRHEFIKPGTWVQPKRGLFKGDVGVVCKTLPQTHECLVLFIPRPRLPDNTGNKRKRMPRPQPKLINLMDPLFRSLQVKESHPMVCEVVGCAGGLSCTHVNWDEQYQWLGQTYEGSLALVKLRLPALELASSMTTSIRGLFLRSRHPFVLSFYPLYAMPPPSDWVFQIGEEVCVVNPGIDAAHAEQLYGAPFGTEGTVQSVEDTHCEVCVSLTEAPVSKIVRMPINALLKKIAVGDTVEIVGGEDRKLIKTVYDKSTPMIEYLPLRGHVGSVVELWQEGNSAKVVLGRFDATLELPLNWLHRRPSGSAGSEITSTPQISTFVTEQYRSSACFVEPDAGGTTSSYRDNSFTGRYAPWAGTLVVPIAVNHSHKGYRGMVKDIKEDPSTVSGLLVGVLPNVVGTLNQIDWFDYNRIRHADTYKFLHDNGKSGNVLPHLRFLNFKPGYIPQYSAEEQRRFRLRSRTDPYIHSPENLQARGNAEAHLQQSRDASHIADGSQTPCRSTPALEDGPAFPISTSASAPVQWTGQTASGSQTPCRSTPALEDGSAFPISTSPSPCAPVQWTGHWILNPDLIKGLGDRNMIIQVLENFNVGWKDYRVHYKQNFDGEHEVFYRKEHPGGSKSGPHFRLTLSQLPPDTKSLKSQTLGRPATAMGLYIVLHPPEHAGMMGRRVGQIYSKEAPEESLWIIQPVRMKKFNTSKADHHEQEVITQLQPLTLDRRWIAQVHETVQDRKAGNSVNFLKKLRDYYHEQDNKKRRR
ncbi:hypothetical protein DFH05DRAFT_1526195 [Lentinula detonsa]|uniref:Chromatin elongation factor spt5 n=1 Tax=Lentinula detonsa TaxID=2804962 RepID=A0A9W8NZN2_9AGAR|nr:hypothetical protein DFH05DRAFT_1526195 [Lentinula detonsa]